MSAAKVLLALGALAAVGTVAVVATRSRGATSDKPADDRRVPKPTPDPPPVEPQTPLPYEAMMEDAGGGQWWLADLTGLSNGVRWRIWKTQLPASIVSSPADLLNWIQADNQEDINAATLANGLEGSDPEARARIEAELLALLNVTPDGSAAPPLVAQPIEIHGVRLAADCLQLQVTDLATWVAWASPWLASRAKSHPNANTLVRDLLATAFEGMGCPIEVDQITVGGTPLPTLVAAADAIAFANARAGYASVASSTSATPMELAAAKLVDRSLGVQGPPSFPYRGWAVYLAPQGNGWRWQAWRRGKSGAAPELNGLTQKEDAAVNQARSAVIAANK